jgi:formylglycine-generating enzyme required for sulfatase activity
MNIGHKPTCVLFAMLTVAVAIRLANGAAGDPLLELEAVPAGTFEMGDHAGLGGVEHGNDEIPIHSVTLDAFSIGRYEVTTAQYCAFLSNTTASVSNGYAVGNGHIYGDTYASDGYSRIVWSNGTFSVRDSKEDHPVTGIRWFGAIAFCNWLSGREGLDACYDLTTGDCDFTRHGYRLPTEAEWEYAARGGLHAPYGVLPWGNDTNSTNRANWPSSGDPFESGDFPHTTPVGYYDGSDHEGYQTQDGSNGYGLHDMSGNVWEWVNDWYHRDYYSVSPATNPPGPDAGSTMPDGNTWRGMRGGNWYNGEEYYGHGRCANRDPGYYRGPLDPNHPYYHVGFRVVLSEGTQETNAPTEQTIGLQQCETNACPGYTLVAPKHYTNTYLINLDGECVHEWTTGYEPGQSAYLLQNGNLLRACFVKHSGSLGGGEGGRLEEYTWDGSMVWEFNYYASDYSQHHDIEPLPNGNVLMLVVEKRTYAELIQAGFNPALLNAEVISEGYLLPDSVIEVEPVWPSSGNIVWEWRVWDHLIQDYDPTKDNYGVVADHPELIDPNQDPKKQFWNHMNGIDYNPDLDQVMLSVRGNNEIWVIDHSTTTAEAAGHAGGRSGKGGDLLYRWGNPRMYDAPGDEMLLQQHDAQWIEPGCPGAGNILVFNNGLGRDWSSVDEFVSPTPDADGNYALTTGQAYAPSNLLWTYTDPTPTNMYAEAISGCQRLPNGNTLICDGTHGKLREVTAAGDTVWSYVCPVDKQGPMVQGETPQLDVRGHQYNAVFKVRRYMPDYPGLQGKDLTSRGTIETYSGVDTDTDNDLILDVWETNHFQNTTTATASSDYDGDGVLDVTEFENGIDPRSADTDDDGMDDGDEIVADTNPADSTSLLCITGVDSSISGTSLSWQGGIAATQMIEYTDNLAAEWLCIYTNEPPTATESNVTLETTGEVRFFRIRVE